MTSVSLTLPVCFCGAKNEWLSQSRQKKSRLVISGWQCGSCLRPGRLIRHEGGNAFVIPRALVYIFPKEAIEYVEKSLLNLFHANARRLWHLRDRYEAVCYQQICHKLGLPQQYAWRPLTDFQLPTFMAMVAMIYKDVSWLEPTGFDASPIPDFVPPHLIVHVLHVRSSKTGDPESSWWTKFSRSK
ncbi:MAG: hypothetical protein A3C06_04130 [Candidatus Taylorbacteria bacterium RIFCSPHIGHO2_02_FULL_46_13]|uniref:Uncharacterized protein n=1 Tax=Candidatus Taylorbacteria bacterium RIFCSPHIGHO2_02_FULL_46_13 TaxID=1802312 RepID=A0A1G2MU52_9BACT|nr:MAG: hypothetical protein A3C06_04130 [Candidatus Taylorbacteria bacterium RIFCSPHIGHO2_02_FULL_46_13]